MVARALGIAIALLLAGQAGAQIITGISSRWNDSFVEWDIYLRSEDPERIQEARDNGEPWPEDIGGELKLRWLNVRDDFSEWDFEVAGQQGTIKMKWKDDPTHWELRSFAGDVITMRALWPNDPTEWRITDNQYTLVFRSRWTNQWDEWLVRDEAQFGRFYLYTLQAMDPRDWAVDDQMAEEISPAMRLAMIFIAVFQSMPKI